MDAMHSHLLSFWADVGVCNAARNGLYWQRVLLLVYKGWCWIVFGMIWQAVGRMVKRRLRCIIHWLRFRHMATGACVVDTVRIETKRSAQ